MSLPLLQFLLLCVPNDKLRLPGLFDVLKAPQPGKSSYYY
jgi:hypothetical protein